MITERRAYTRYVIQCDNCGREENTLRWAENKLDDLPTVFGWKRVPAPAFAADEYHACSEACVRALLERHVQGVMA